MIIVLLLALICLILEIVNVFIDVLIPNRFTEYFHLGFGIIYFIGLLLCLGKAIICIIAEVL